MTIKDIHDWIDFITNKATGVYFTSEEKDMALDRAQMRYFNEQYSVYALAQKMQDSLSPFKSKYTFLTAPEGLLSMPANYQYLLSGQVVVMEGEHIRYRALKVLSEDELAYRLNSQLRPVTIAKPVATIAGKVSGITLVQLYPKSNLAGEINYLRRPNPPKFGYTGEGREAAYDSASSVQMEWGESELSEIMVRAIESLGINAEDQMVAQYADIKSKQIN